MIFVLGVCVGVAATLAFTFGADEPENVVESQPERVSEPQPVVEAIEPSAPQDAEPVVDSAPEVEIPVFPELPVPAPLHEALADVDGDVEALIIEGDTFIGGRAAQLLAGDEFSRLVSALSRSPSVRAAEHYQRLFNEYHQLPSVRNGAVIVQSLACGRRVCAANLVGYDAASVDQAWADLTGTPAERGPMMLSGDGFEVSFREEVITGSLLTEGPNGTERRLLITVDPTVRSVTTGFNVVVHEGLPGGGS